MSEINQLLSALESAASPDSDEEPHAVALLARQLAVADDLDTATGATALRAARALSVYGPAQTLPKAAELAAKAHRESIAGAGVLFAECVDRVNLMSGQPQSFGTVTTQHQGDQMLAPIDKSITDEMRAQLGVPTLDQLQTQIQRHNEDAARKRAAAAGGTNGSASGTGGTNGDGSGRDGASKGELPMGQRFARVWHDPSPDWLQSKLAEHPQRAWADGDELTFACKSSSRYGLIAGPVFELPLWRVTGFGDGDLVGVDSHNTSRLTNPDGSEQLWALTVRVERLSEAVIGYGFWEIDEFGGLAGGGMRGPVDHRFRGPDAPDEISSTPDDQLRGTVITEALASTALRENRLVTVYLPPDHQSNEKLPVVYATDGNGVGPYIRRIDAGISKQSVPRFVLVAAHAAPMSAYSNERALEYLPGFDEKRFDRHQQFFVSELAQWAQDRFGVSDERDKRAVFGCSDGGGHALATGHMNRERFGHCIAYSTGLPPNDRMGWEADKAPYVHLCAGTLEGAFFDATHAWAAWLHFAKSPHHWTERVCGHDLIQWIEELPRALARAWG